MLPLEQPDRIQIAFDDHRLLGNVVQYVKPPHRHDADRVAGVRHPVVVKDTI